MIEKMSFDTEHSSNSIIMKLNQVITELNELSKSIQYDGKSIQKYGKSIQYVPPEPSQQVQNVTQGDSICNPTQYLKRTTGF